MLHRLTPLRARLLLLLALGMSLWCGAQALRPPSPPLPVISDYTDLQLYRAIVQDVRAGKGYHQAARDQQHAHNFPTRPFVTIRLPTLAHLAAWLGWPVLQCVLAALLLGAGLLWVRCLTGLVHRAEALAAGLAALTGGAMVTSAGIVPLHELWAGVLLCAAMALRGGRAWWVALMLAGAALAIRELALPFALLALAFALIERRRGEAAGWAGLIAVFGVLYWLHVQQVLAVVPLTDKESLPWNAMRGAFAPVRDVVSMSLLEMLPKWLAFAITPLALLGWAAIPGRKGPFGLLYCLGIALMIALFSREDTAYWAVMLTPVWFIGFAFVPRALAGLLAKAR